VPGAHGTTPGWVHSLTSSLAPLPPRPPARHDAPSGSVHLVDVVDLESDICWVDQLGEHSVRRRTEHNVAGVYGVGVPIAAGVFEPAFGLVLRPEIAALSMSGSSLLVAVNALLLKRLPLPEPPVEADAVPATPARPTAPVGGHGSRHQ
jgi:Cu2+-exporting ATPase